MFVPRRVFRARCIVFLGVLLVLPLGLLLGCAVPAPQPPPETAMSRAEGCQAWGEIVAAMVQSREMGEPPTAVLAVLRRPGVDPAMQAAVHALLGAVYAGHENPARTRQAFEGVHV